MDEMTVKTQTLYFDEAGYTGNNLLDPEQPVFVYAGVAIDEKNATQLRDDTLARSGISARELKGTSLLKRSSGRKAISWLLSEVSTCTHLMVVNKEYALGGKFFEEIFEPVLSENSLLFYSTGFHKFIATLLNVWQSSGDHCVDSALRNFSDTMRSMDPDQIDSVLSPLAHYDQSNPIGMIYAFALCHKEWIKAEIRTIKESGNAGNWLLDLSASALHWHLASWSEEFETLEVFCDESQPIREARDIFDVQIGRTEKLYMRLGDLPEIPITYNLAGPINFVNSKMSSGVQIADVVSSSLAYAYKNPDEEHSREWIHILANVPNNQIFPDTDYIDLSKEKAFVNAMVLEELMNRTIKGQNLFEGMEEYIGFVKANFPKYVEEVVPFFPKESG